MNELREKIDESIKKACESYCESGGFWNGVRYDTTNAILDAVIAALPTEMDDGLLYEDGEYGRGYDNCIDEVRLLLQAAKENK